METRIEIIKCVLQSDVIFKAVAKFIEALQTKNWMTIRTTFMSIKPGLVDECKKCMGTE